MRSPAASPLPLAESPAEATTALRAPTATAPWHHAALTLRAPEPFHPTFAPDVLVPCLDRVCAQAGLELTGHTLHAFEPQGASLVLFGPRLRLALHTWPERGVATLDVTCVAGEGGAERLVEAVCLALGLHVTERHQHHRREGSGDAP